jgi:hypothetical protein
MRRARCCLVLLTSALAAGCAGNHENLADTATATAPGVATVTVAPTASAVATVAAAATPAADGTGAITVVDGNQLAARTADTLLCRDMLVRGSNQMRKMCGTAEQWKVYQRREAQAAAEQVRRMQRGIPEDPADWVRRRR